MPIHQPKLELHLWKSKSIAKPRLFYDRIHFRLLDLDVHDQALVALSKAKNNLETFIYDLRDKLEHDSKYKSASTASERSTINEKLTEIDAWLWDDGVNADVKVDDDRILHSC